MLSSHFGTALRVSLCSVRVTARRTAANPPAAADAVGGGGAAPQRHEPRAQPAAAPQGAASAGRSLCCPFTGCGLALQTIRHMRGGMALSLPTHAGDGRRVSQGGELRPLRRAGRAVLPCGGVRVGANGTCSVQQGRRRRRRGGKRCWRAGSCDWRAGDQRAELPPLQGASRAANGHRGHARRQGARAPDVVADRRRRKPDDAASMIHACGSLSFFSAGVRHQGPRAEHQVDSAGGQRRPRVHGHVMGDTQGRRSKWWLHFFCATRDGLRGAWLLLLAERLPYPPPASPPSFPAASAPCAPSIRPPSPPPSTAAGPPPPPSRPASPHLVLVRHPGLPRPPLVLHGDLHVQVARVARVRAARHLPADHLALRAAGAAAGRQAAGGQEV